MIKTIKHHYHKLSSLHKVLIGAILLLTGFVSMFRFLHADSIPFESSLSSIFPWMNTGYYSNAHFTYGGNDFVGIIFWESSETIPTETITISGGTQTISCTEKLKGIYYNNLRGWNIRPLDTGNLYTLQTYGPPATGYDQMTMTGGFYTNCTGVSGYTPQANEVYGQIDHQLLYGQKYTMIAGMEYDFINNTITGTDFSGSMYIASGGIHQGYLFDNNDGIAELSMNMPRCGYFTGLYIYPLVYGNTGIFMCEGNSISGYIFTIYSGGSPIYTYNTSTTSTMIIDTGMYLTTGNYVAGCTILGAGGTQASCPIINFQVGSTTPPLTGTCNPNFQGEITFSPYLLGDIVFKQSVGTYYSNKTGIMIQWAATEPSEFVLSGNLIPPLRTGSYTGNSIFNYAIGGPFTLSEENNFNYILGTFNTGGCTYTDALKRIYVDTLPPTAPTITTPTSGAYICPSMLLSLQRSPAIDSGGISHYIYEMYTSSGMTTSGLVLSQTIVGTTTGVNINISYLPLGTYYTRLLAVDMVGHATPSAPIHFTTSQSYCPVGTGVMIVSPVISITNANLDTVYTSDPIYILGLTGPSLLSISQGTLFINTITGAGTTGIVTSNDTIHIQLRSSTGYNTTVLSTLSIMGTTGTFSITTKPSNCILSTGEQLVIQNIYQNLKANYNNDIYKLAEFLHTFQSMVNDEVDLTNSCTLEYLLQLIQDDLGFQGGIDTSNHITPNCKQYSIGYDISELAYYSPDMKNRYYFINRESLIRHLDYYNPGDCHVNTYGTNYRAQDTSNPMRHVAPNGKIYNIVIQYGGFSALEFISPKHFDSLDAIKHYINIKNPSATIRQHIADTSFFPIVYAAPNGKEYKILKTNRGFMSYKLMKVQYFSSLGELKGYIDKNNPSKR